MHQVLFRHGQGWILTLVIHDTEAGHMCCLRSVFEEATHTRKDCQKYSLININAGSDAETAAG